METPLFFLAGPTGTGKTATAIALCQLLNGEIISADSMQIYRGCDIVTAKASPAERAAAPHHLIDICDPRETYSAARWAEDAKAAIASISARGKLPLIVGGTGFYINALLHPNRLAATPPDPQMRLALEAEAAEHGNQWLHDKLKALDKAAAARLHPNDLHRVTRAIEIALSEKNPESRIQNPEEQPTAENISYRAFGLEMEREKLYARLEARVDGMLAEGALDELKSLLASGVPREAPALQGVGYRQLLPALEDESILPEAIELWKRDTRRYAKRQMTWFRHQLKVQWVPIDENTQATDTARQIAELWHQHTK